MAPTVLMAAVRLRKSDDSLFGNNIYHLIIGESMGPWSQSEGKLICTATQKSMYVSAGSYGYDKIVDIPVKIITTFVIFKYVYIQKIFWRRRINLAISGCSVVNLH